MLSSLYSITVNFDNCEEISNEGLIDLGDGLKTLNSWIHQSEFYIVNDPFFHLSFLTC